jgi:abortive infection bacteriophage resistance protein
LTVPTTLPEEQRTRVGLLLLYSMRYTKQPLDYPDILAMLKERGLVINNDDKAIDCLRVISYFRLANYFHPMEADKVNHIFKSNSHFENAVDLYEFDRELRGLIFSAIQAVEIALRSKMIHHISLSYGSFWFTDASLFRNIDIFNGCLQHIRQEVERSREDFIVDHYDRYTEPDLPPVWKTLEVTTFGTLSKLFGNFKDNAIKKRIAREFNLPQHVILESWIKCAVVMRNFLAHHSRVWNRSFPIIPLTSARLHGRWITHHAENPNKLYIHLCYLKYMLDSIKPDNHFAADLKNLLQKHPNIDIFAMGFPTSWRTEPIWQ